MNEEMNGRSLVDCLSLGAADLMTVLVNCGISCRSCAQNPERKGWSEGGIICEKSDPPAFIAAPELSVCLKWREGRTEEEIKKGSKLYREEEEK